MFLSDAPSAYPKGLEMFDSAAPSRPTAVRAAVPVVLLTTLLVTLNTAIVNVALSAIQGDLGFSPASASRVVNGYLLTYGGFLIVGGKLGDIIGRRRSMLLGLIVFTVAAGVAGIAWAPSVLIVARLVQGVGGALATPAVLAIITHLLHGEARGKALVWFSIVSGSGFSLGFIFGGLIDQWLSWRWIFFLDVPAGLILIVLTAVLVPAMRAEHRARLDLPGALLATMTAVGLVFAFVQLAGAHRFDAAAGASLVVAVLAFVGLAFRLRRAAEPLVPLQLFARRTAVGAFAANALLGGAGTGVTFFLSELFGIQLELAPLAIGGLFLLFTVPQLASALSAGRLIGRVGVRRFVAVSLPIALIGIFLLAFAVSAGALGPLLLIGMVLTGLGIGGVTLAVNLTVLSAVEPRIAGAASGVLQSTLQLGASVGIALLVLVQAVLGTPAAFVAAGVLIAAALVALSVSDRKISVADSRELEAELDEQAQI